MRILRIALTAAVILPTTGCFQSSTVIRVKADGSGTIEQRLLLTEQALDQLRAFTILGGGNADAADPTSEAQARALAAVIGPGVAYVSSTPITSGRSQGRESTYSFSDITQLRISEQPTVPGSQGLKAAGVNTGTDPITFGFGRTPDGNAVLRILVPRPAIFPTGPNGETQPPTLEQITMVRQLLAGARLTVAVEPAGRLTQTSSPFVDGNRVTLLDLDIDRAASDPDLAKKLQSIKSTEDTQAIVNSIPGLKITLQPEISIEFVPAP
jgi:hypothetical protein